MDCKYLYIDNIKINFVRRIIEIDGEAISLTRVSSTSSNSCSTT